MKIRLNNKKVIFIKKDKTLFENEWKVVKEQDKTGFVYLDDTQGVSILPYRFDKNGKMEVLIREEPNPLHNSILTVIAGKRDEDEVGSDWWKETAQRELGEESGYWVDNKNRFSSLGNVVVGKDYKEKDVFTCIDLTGIEQGKMKPDKGMIEKNSKNFWVSVDLLKRMLLERGNNIDSYFLALTAKFLSFMGLMEKSEVNNLMKAVEAAKTTSRGPSPQKGKQKPGHKYIRREGSPGEYRYIYKEPEGKEAKEEEGKPKGILAQLVEVLGKKKGEEKEKAPPKIKPLEEYASVPKGTPDFKKGVTMEQWIGQLDKDVSLNIGEGLVEVLKEHPNNFHISLRRMFDKSGVYYHINESIVSKEINIENKKLDDRVKASIQKGIVALSLVYQNAEHANAVMNSSIVENMFSILEERLADANSNLDLFPYRKLDLLDIPTDKIFNSLKFDGSVIKNLKWLEKQDPKLDLIMDKIYESVDRLMKARNRYIEDSVVFFINQIESKINDINDLNTFETVALLINGLHIFNKNVILKSATSKEIYSFVNQWNLKQKGIYDGVSRYLSESISKFVNKYRNIVDQGNFPDSLSKEILNRNDVFDFLTLDNSWVNRKSTVSEQVFSYIDSFGLDEYYRDVVFMSSVNKKISKFPSTLEKTIELFDAIYNGEQVLMGPIMSNSSAPVSGVLDSIAFLNPKSTEDLKVMSFIRLWSNFSHGSIISNAIEEFAASRGIDKSSFVNYHIASNRTINAKSRELKQTMLKAMEDVYNFTQSIIAKEMDEEIWLYRGNGEQEVKSIMSSWSWKEDVASRFGHDIVEAKVPQKAIFAYNSPETEKFWDFKDEEEFIVVPGLLNPNERFKTKRLTEERKQQIQDKELTKLAQEGEETGGHLGFTGETY
jgi:hypothetical protein